MQVKCSISCRPRHLSNHFSPASRGQQGAQKEHDWVLPNGSGKLGRRSQINRVDINVGNGESYHPVLIMHVSSHIWMIQEQ